MRTARRLYLYGMAGLALTALLSGVGLLVWLVFDKIEGSGQGGNLIAPAVDPTREELSLAIALILVALPIWFAYWLVTERAARAPDEAGAAERTAVSRAWYFVVVPGILLSIGALWTANVVRDGLNALFGGSAFSGQIDLSTDLSIAIVGLGAWAYHSWVRARDIRSGALSGSPAWISRLYLYGTLLVGALAVIEGVSTLIWVAIYLWTGPTPFGQAGGWWIWPVSVAVAQIAVGGFFWVLHWSYGQRLRTGETAWSAEERASRVRLTYFMAIVLFSVATVVASSSEALFQLMSWVLGLARPEFADSRAQAVATPVLTMLPFVLAWAWHRQRARRETAALDPWQPGLSGGRIADHLAAMVGLTASASGAASLLGMAIDLAFGGTRALELSGDALRSGASQSLAMMIVGGVLWLGMWYRLERARERHPELGSGSTSRRGYLYLVIGTSVAVAASAIAFTAYRVIRVVLGLETGSLVSETSTALGLGLVALIVLAYHMWELRRDLGLVGGPPDQVPPGPGQDLIAPLPPGSAGAA